MGGLGSGRHRWNASTANYPQIDVRLMQRRGYLRPGMRSVFCWSRNGETGILSALAEPDRITLTWRQRRNELEDSQSREYPILLSWTRCNYGGMRAWFLCPALGCGRRVAVLWGGAIFACRQCHNLAYKSQNETAHSRALSKAQAIRMKLGGSANLTLDFPEKPKGMHWRTYWRLRAKAMDCESRMWPTWVFEATST